MKKAYVFVITVVLLLVVVGMLSYFKIADAPTAGETIEENTHLYSIVNDMYGFSFEYGGELNDPFVREVGKQDSSQPTVSYSIFSKAEYQSATEGSPSELPPSVQINIYNNTQGLDALLWAKSHTEFSNYSDRKGLDKKMKTVEIGGIEGILYETDGLYQNRVAIIVHDGYAYVFTGSYDEVGSPIYRTFDTVIDTFSFDKRTQ